MLLQLIIALVLIGVGGFLLKRQLRKKVVAPPVTPPVTTPPVPVEPTPLPKVCPAPENVVAVKTNS